GGDATVFFSTPSSDWAFARAARTSGPWQASAPLKDDYGRALKLVEGFDVVFGPVGDIHVAYTRPAGGLGYAVFDGCRWSEVVVDVASDGSAPSIALDPAGRPHFAYQNVVPNEGAGTPPDMTVVWYAAPRL